MANRVLPLGAPYPPSLATPEDLETLALVRDHGPVRINREEQNPHLLLPDCWHYLGRTFYRLLKAGWVQELPKDPRMVDRWDLSDAGRAALEVRRG